MLARVSQYFRRHKLALMHGGRELTRTPWTTMGTVLAIALTLLLPLLCWALITAVSPLLNDWREGEEIALYLDTSCKPQHEIELLEKVRATQGVARARFISADESLAQFEKQEGMSDLRNYLPENPLPSMIEVLPTPEMSTPAQMEQLFETLKQYPHVEQAKMNREWVGKLHAMLHFLEDLAWFLAGLFTLMVLFIIRNLLRLLAKEHHDEIQVLKLIGATDAFVLRPFLYTGIFLGGLGALLAFFSVQIILWGLQLTLHPLVAPGLSVTTHMAFAWLDLIWCLAGGVMLGWLGAYLSLKYQLVHIEPYQ